MILKYSFLGMGNQEQLLAYQQGVLDIAAYNSALLKVAKPSMLGLGGENGKNADACFKRILDCANDWMLVTVPHCRIVPKTIQMYDWLFKDNMDTLMQGLGVLIENPKAQETRESLASLLTGMSEIMSSYQDDIQELITGIETYFTDMGKNAIDFDTLLDVVATEIKLDEAEKERLKGEVSKTIKELWDARLRLTADEVLLKKKWFIFVSILELGIPLLIVEIDKMQAEGQVKSKSAQLENFRTQLADTERLLLALYATQTAYKELLADVKKILTSADDILGIWRKFSETCADFAEKVVDEKALFEKVDLKEAVEEIKVMKTSWERISALAKPLSEMNYEVVEIKVHVA